MAEIHGALGEIERTRIASYERSVQEEVHAGSASRHRYVAPLVERGHDGRRRDPRLSVGGQSPFGRAPVSEDDPVGVLADKEELARRAGRRGIYPCFCGEIRRTETDASRSPEDVVRSRVERAVSEFCVARMRRRSRVGTDRKSFRVADAVFEGQHEFRGSVIRIFGRAGLDRRRMRKGAVGA